MKRNPYTTPEEYIQNDIRRRRFSDTKEKQMLKKKFPHLTESEMNALLSIPPKTEEFEMFKDGSQKSVKVLRIASEQDKTPINLLRLHGYDPEVWEIISSKQKTWNAYSKKDGISDLYSSTIVVQPIAFITPQYILKTFNSLKPRAFTTVYPSKSTIDRKPMLLEPAIFDVHIAKLCWAKETGNDYDLKIATERFAYVISEIVKEASMYPIKEIILPIGNDLFNADNDKGSTTSGTMQSMDSRWQKMYFSGCQTIINGIETLRQLAKVKVKYVPGNHDKTLSYFLILNTSAWYRNDKDVEVDISPAPRKYVQFGKCMIGFSHGEEKKKNLHLVMQSEAPDMWGATKYREFHLGHLHSEQVEELPGIKLRRISTITGLDDYHVSMGYVGTIKQAQAFLWDEEKGLKHIINVVVE